MAETILGIMVGLAISIGIVDTYFIGMERIPVLIEKENKEYITYIYCKRKLRNEVIKNVKNCIDLKEV